MFKTVLDKAIAANHPDVPHMAAQSVNVITIFQRDCHKNRFMFYLPSASSKEYPPEHNLRNQEEPSEVLPLEHP